MMILNKLFEAEEINGAHRCPTHLYRWTLLKTSWFKIYLHHFVGDDFSRDLHDHPKRFTSIGIWGRYIEETPDGEREWRAPWARSFPPEHIHRIRSAYSGGAWTLVIVGRQRRQWGFWHNGTWIEWREYLQSPVADKMKACD